MSNLTITPEKILQGTFHAILRDYPAQKKCMKCYGRGTQRFVRDIGVVIDFCLCVRKKIDKAGFMLINVVTEEKPLPQPPTPTKED